MSVLSSLSFQFPTSTSDMLIYFSCAIGVVLIVLPLVAYLVTHWPSRRDDLLQLLSDAGIKRYYALFHPRYDESARPLTAPASATWYRRLAARAIQLARPPRLPDIRQDFMRHYHRRYGRRYYLFPIALLFILAVITAVPAVSTLVSWSQNKPGLLSRTMMAAFAGAFMWVLVNEFDRFRNQDLTPYDIYGYVVRILIAVPFGWAVDVMTGHTPSIGVPVAFFLGAFPTRTLLKMSRRLTAEKLKLTGDQQEVAMELEKLQSISRSAAERFADEGIGSILELAYADPIDLSMRTNFSFYYVRGCVSQALLWIYFPEQHLQHLALRGATEVGNLVRDHEEYHRAQCGMHVKPRCVDDDSYYLPAGTLDDQPPDASKKYDDDLQKRRHDETQDVIDDVAKELKISPGALMATLRQVAYDPYTRFLRKMWKDMGERQKGTQEPRKEPTEIVVPRATDRARAA